MYERPGEPGYVSIDREPHCPICEAVLRYCPGHEAGANSVEMMPMDMGISISFGGPVKVKAPRAGDNWGYFSGDPVARWTNDGERMVLMEPFAYTDRRAKRWDAAKGAILDGASIPRFFWRLVGSPYRGKYRYASIIHDYHCVIRSSSWQSVHYMFYEACMCGGTGHQLAKLLYYAVRHFGPKWGGNLGLNSSPRRYTDRDLEEIERWIAHVNPSRAEIDMTTPDMIGVNPVKVGRRTTR